MQVVYMGVAYYLKSSRNPTNLRIQERQTIQKCHTNLSKKP